MSIGTLFELHNVESRASLARDRVRDLEALLGSLELSDLVEFELERMIDAEKANLATLERRLRSVGTKERLDLVLHAIEACFWSEVTDEEEEELKAEAALLRCRLLREEGKAPAPIAV